MTDSTEPAASGQGANPSNLAQHFKIDEEFKSLVPPLSDAKLAGLERSLLIEGCRNPLVIWKGHDVLVDGHHRHDLCVRGTASSSTRRKSSCPTGTLQGSG